MMPAPRAVLHGYYRSSTSYRLRILLNLKHIPHDIVPVALDRGAQREPAFLEVNPMGGVPVVDLDGHRLVQSPAIIEFIEERFPEPRLLPESIPARQRVREITALVACDIHPLNNLRVLKHLRATYGLDDEAIGAWYRHWIDAGFGALEHMVAQSGGGVHAVGDRITLAEVYLVPQIYNARRFDVDMSRYPLLEAIDAHCATLKAFIDAHPDRHQPD